MKICPINHEDTLIDEFVGYGLSAVGFLFQISGRFGVSSVDVLGCIVCVWSVGSSV